MPSKTKGCGSQSAAPQSKKAKLVSEWGCSLSGKQELDASTAAFSELLAAIDAGDKAACTKVLLDAAQALGLALLDNGLDAGHALVSELGGEALLSRRERKLAKAYLEQLRTARDVHFHFNAAVAYERAIYAGHKPLVRALRQRYAKLVDKNAKLVDTNGKLVETNGKLVDENAKLVDENAKLKAKLKEAEKKAEAIEARKHRFDVFFKRPAQKVFDDALTKLRSTLQKNPDFAKLLEKKDEYKCVHNLVSDLQAFLNKLKYNVELEPTSVRKTVEMMTSHCVAGALTSYFVLTFHGHEATLLGWDATDESGDTGHAVCCYRTGDRYGTCGVSSYPMLKDKSPLFTELPDLVAAYFDAHVDEMGSKTMEGWHLKNLWFDTEVPASRWVWSKPSGDGVEQLGLNFDEHWHDTEPLETIWPADSDPRKQGKKRALVLPPDQLASVTGKLSKAKKEAKKAKA